ncbi:MAG: protein kinase [Gemmatimonadaceae bacterium]|nr:protein kinase [Gemmatimonadaceae bacterium]
MPAESPPPDGAHWERMSRLFETLLSLPPRERASFLDATCGGDVALRSELASLVAAHDGAPAYLDAFHTAVLWPALTSGVAAAPSPAEPSAPATPGDALPRIELAPGIEPGMRIRHFTVHERLGSGGAGVVHRGRDTLLDRDVALKFLAPRLSGDPVARARLVAEAQAASRLDDPHVCAMHAVEATADGGLCLVMGFCAGGTLRDRLRQAPIPPASVHTIALHLARGLASAHRAGIVHGDIKPANVGFGEGDVARLLDFGIAAYVDRDGAGQRGLHGTLPYLAPELWRGGARGPRSDVWALGVTFFEMVTGRRPFPSADPETLAAAICGGQVPVMTHADGTPVAPALDALIRRMLRVDAADRPADGAAVLATLEEPPASPAAPLARTDAPRPRVRRAVGILVAGAAVLVGGRTLWSTVRATAVPALEVARTAGPLSSIAVLPFTTRGGRDIGYLTHGMIDLLTPAFDATGLVRGIDPNTVIGAAGDGASRTLDSASAQALASQVRADRYVMGSVVGSGATLTIRATLRQRDGREVGRAQATIPESGGLATAIDALVRQLIATELLAPGDTVAGIAAATTQSTRALRLYLDGERDLRDARPASAVAHFQQAVAADSQFALAWYRLARAARWNTVDSLSVLAARRAAALAGTLPPRQQALVRAYHTLRFGSPLEAERQFAQIVADYPTDVEAWMLLGEAQFGSNPFYGRPLAASGAAFRRVMALDPRNREVTVYLMDLAAAARQTGQLDTLFTMYFSPNSAGEQPGIRAAYLALHRRRIPGAARVRGSSPLDDDPASARVALLRVSSDPADRRDARVLADLVAAAPDARYDGLQARAALDIAEGNWNAAQASLRDAATIAPDDAADLRALMVLAPAVRAGADTMATIRRDLLARRTGAAQYLSQELTPTEREDIRHYLAGVLSARLGDASGVTAARAALDRRARSASRVAAALSQAVAGHWLLRQGDASGAVSAFARSIPDLPARLRRVHPALEQHLDRLARASALERLGRHAEALGWYRSVGEGFGVIGVPFAAASDSGVVRTTRP